MYFCGFIFYDWPSFYFDLHFYTLLWITWEIHIAVCVCEGGVYVLYPLHPLTTAQPDSHFVDILLPVHKHILKKQRSRHMSFKEEQELENYSTLITQPPAWATVTLLKRKN